MNRAKTIYTDAYIELVMLLGDERKRLGLSQLEVAEKLNMAQSDISKIETLERRLDVLEFKKLLSIYRVDENKKLRSCIMKFLNLDEHD